MYLSVRAIELLQVMQRAIQKLEQYSRLACVCQQHPPSFGAPPAPPTAVNRPCSGTQARTLGLGNVDGVRVLRFDQRLRCKQLLRRRNKGLSLVNDGCWMGECTFSTLMLSLALVSKYGMPPFLAHLARVTHTYK